MQNQCESQRFLRTDGVFYSEIINYTEYISMHWNWLIDSPVPGGDSLHSLACNVTSVQLCGWVASGEKCDTRMQTSHAGQAS